MPNLLLAGIALALVLVADAPLAEAHGGGLNHCGCHVNHTTGECHCHHDYGCGCSCEPPRCDREDER